MTDRIIQGNLSLLQPDGNIEIEIPNTVRPNYQQICSIPAERKRSGNVNLQPMSLQSMAFVDKNTAILIRASWSDTVQDAIVIDLTTGDTNTYRLGANAGHANCVVLKDDKLYVATGTGIAVFTYPGFSFIENITYNGYSNGGFWSLAYDDKRSLWYVLYQDTYHNTIYCTENISDSDGLKKYFEVPEFFINGETSRGCMSYKDNIFYISKHLPNNIARIKVTEDKNGNIDAKVLDVSEFPKEYGEIEQLAFCEDKIYACSYISFYSTYVYYIYLVDYTHTQGQTTKPMNYFNTIAYVNQKKFSNIKRDGSSTNPFCCIEEALATFTDPWTHQITLQSDHRKLELHGVNVKLVCENYTINGLDVYDSNIHIEGGNITGTNRVGLGAYNSSVVLANTTVTGSPYDVSGNGSLVTTKPINANFSGPISGGGAPSSINARGYSNYLTSGFVNKLYNKNILPINRVGEFVLFVIAGLQNTKTFIYPLDIIKDRTITRLDTFIYEGSICPVTYTINITTNNDEGVYEFNVSTLVSTPNGDVNVKPTLLLASF